MRSADRERGVREYEGGEWRDGGREGEDPICGRIGDNNAPRAGLQTIMEMYARDAECSMSDCGGGNNEGGVSRLALQLVHMRVHIVLWGSCLLLG